MVGPGYSLNDATETQHFTQRMYIIIITFKIRTFADA